MVAYKIFAATTGVFGVLGDFIGGGVPSGIVSSSSELKTSPISPPMVAAFFSFAPADFLSFLATDSRLARFIAVHRPGVCRAQARRRVRGLHEPRTRTQRYRRSRGTRAFSCSGMNLPEFTVPEFASTSTSTVLDLVLVARILLYHTRTAVY